MDGSTPSLVSGSGLDQFHNKLPLRRGIRIPQFCSAPSPCTFYHEYIEAFAISQCRPKLQSAQYRRGYKLDILQVQVSWILSPLGTVLDVVGVPYNGRRC
jgi:hypothetical protein